MKHKGFVYYGLKREIFLNKSKNMLLRVAWLDFHKIIISNMYIFTHISLIISDIIISKVMKINMLLNLLF